MRTRAAIIGDSYSYSGLHIAPQLLHKKDGGELSVLAEGATDSDAKFASGSRYMRTSTSAIIAFINLSPIIADASRHMRTSVYKTDEPSMLF